MKKILFFMIAIATFGMSFSGFCHEKIDDSSTQEEIFEKIVDNKGYLKPGTVVVASTGIFLIVQSQLISIPGIEADSEGVYMKLMPGVCAACGFPMKNLYECSNEDCITKRRR